MKLPIDRAYEAADNAIAVPCDHCGAERNSYCTKADGRLSRIPCLSRAQAAAANDAQRRREVVRNSDFPSSSPPGASSERRPAIDFAEPRHAQAAAQ